MAEKRIEWIEPLRKGTVDEFFPEASKPIRDLLLSLIESDDYEDVDSAIEAFRRFAWFPKQTSEQIYNFKHDAKTTLKDLKPPKVGTNVATHKETGTFLQIMGDFNRREHNNIPIRLILLIHSALVDAGKFTLDCAYSIFDWIVTWPRPSPWVMNNAWKFEIYLENHRNSQFQDSTGQTLCRASEEI